MRLPEGIVHLYDKENNRVIKAQEIFMGDLL